MDYTQDEIVVKIAEHYKDALEWREQGLDVDEIIQACVRWARDEKVQWSEVKKVAGL
jgi:hypothetical protein